MFPLHGSRRFGCYAMRVRQVILSLAPGGSLALVALHTAQSQSYGWHVQTNSKATIQFHLCDVQLR